MRLIGREAFRHLATARQELSGKPEDVIRETLYEPLFASLGFQATVNKKGSSSLEEPDYPLSPAVHAFPRRIRLHGRRLQQRVPPEVHAP